MKAGPKSIPSLTLTQNPERRSAFWVPVTAGATDATLPNHSGNSNPQQSNSNHNHRLQRGTTLRHASSKMKVRRVPFVVLDVCGMHAWIRSHPIDTSSLQPTWPSNAITHPPAKPTAATHPPPPSPAPRLYPAPPASPVAGRGQALALLAGGAGLHHDRALVQGLRVRARPERECVARSCVWDRVNGRCD